MVLKADLPLVIDENRNRGGFIKAIEFAPNQLFLL